MGKAHHDQSIRQECGSGCNYREQKSDARFPAPGQLLAGQPLLYRL
jgi:hypothetical protein